MHGIPAPAAASPQNGRRRRLQGSCDICRKKKVRCDSAQMPGNRCSNCIASFAECTHARTKMRIQPVEIFRSHESPYTEIPMNAQEHVAAILSTATVYIPSQDPNVSHRILVLVAQYARRLEEKTAALQEQATTPTTTSRQSPESLGTQLSTDNSKLAPAEDGALLDAYDHVPMRDASTDLVVSDSKKLDRFHGPSSCVELVKTAMRHMNGNTSYVIGVRRPEFWSTQPWEKLTSQPVLSFPEDDLLQALITIYFDQINPILGLLHFPSFQQSISDGLHLRDPEFGALVLTVCSLASRHSDDPRVFMDDANSAHSCGWKWFRQVRPFRVSFVPEPSLYRLQFICLGSIYTNGISIPEESWMLCSLGIRLAHAAGAHHRDRYRNMDPLKAELYRRVFWVLVVTDTLMSSFNGRPTITNPCDIAIDFPVACDHEYWGIPNAQQPDGKPSTSAFTNVYMRLFLILGRIQRAAYPLDGQRCSEEVVVELDSALNEWIDIIPDHLRWDPHQQNQIFLDQSAALYSTYYHAQILLHRGFIPPPTAQSSSETHFPSLAIVANAARATGHVLDIQARRGRGLLHYPALIIALFDSAIVLLFNVWAVFGGQKPRTPDYFTRATADAEKCVRVLRLYERRWRVAGRSCDIINAMLKHASDVQSSRRSQAESSASRNVPNVAFASTEGSGLDPLMPVAEPLQTLGDPIEEMHRLLSLPLLTEELGRLPIYDSFHYEPTLQLDELYHPPQSDFEFPTGSAEPELFYGLDPALESIFSAPKQVGLAVGEDVQMSFDMPSSYSWQDWSTYLAGVDGGSN
ncbi:fungal-specific transcription factor domain-containing protein [Mycena galopus ATCC 62051]|nr:fungal-specific transcription factor domain-containing protein [Mycena galopus ATCC 62051]